MAIGAAWAAWADGAWCILSLSPGRSCGSCGMCVLGRVKPRRLQIMSLARRHKRNCETRTRPCAAHNPKLKRGKIRQDDEDRIYWFHDTGAGNITTCE